MGIDEYKNKMNEYQNRIDKVNSNSGHKKQDAANDLLSDMVFDGLEGIVEGIKNLWDKHQQKKWEKKAEAARLENERKKMEEEFKRKRILLGAWYGKLNDIDTMIIFQEKACIFNNSKNIVEFTYTYEQSMLEITFSQENILNIPCSISENQMIWPDDKREIKWKKLTDDEQKVIEKRFEVKRKNAKRRKISFFIILILLIFTFVLLLSANNRNIFFNFIKGLFGGKL